MTWGAAMGASRPAVALLVLGAAGLAVTLGVDLPDVHKTGVIGERFAEAKANPGLGFWFELVGVGAGDSRRGAQAGETGAVSRAWLGRAALSVSA